MSLWRRTKETPEIPQRALWNENPIKGLRESIRQIRVGRHEIQPGILLYKPDTERSPLADEYLGALKNIFGG